MSATMIIDHRSPKPGAAPGAPKSGMADPATNMAAHLIAVTALSMAIAKVVATNAGAEEFEAFATSFSAQSAKLAAQYSAATVRDRAANVTADVLRQLREIHDQRNPGG